jgi:hypothetical protein
VENLEDDEDEDTAGTGATTWEMVTRPGKLRVKAIEAMAQSK